MPALSLGGGQPFGGAPPLPWVGSAAMGGGGGEAEREQDLLPGEVASAVLGGVSARLADSTPVPRFVLVDLGIEKVGVIYFLNPFEHFESARVDTSGKAIALTLSRRNRILEASAGVAGMPVLDFNESIDPRIPTSPFFVTVHIEAEFLLKVETPTVSFVMDGDKTVGVFVRAAFVEPDDGVAIGPPSPTKSK